MAKSVLSTKNKAFQELIRNAPLVPGCYLYKDKNGKILYVGKAKILRNRVKSYFSNFNRVEEKIRQMILLAEDIEFVLADSEIEALIIESVLIKRHKPKYNSLMVDDKSYAYVKFDKISNSHGEFVPMPTITVSRDKEHDKNAEYYGPYPNVGTVKRLLTRLRRLFPYCTGKIKVAIPAERNKPFTSKNHKACFHYQINLCNGACAGLATRGDYEANLNSIKKFFKGEKYDLMYEFEARMRKAAKIQDFETAARYRNMLNDIKYVGSNLHIDKDIDEIGIVQAKQVQKQSAISALISYLDFPVDKLKNEPGFRIECYDISNIQGTNAVGAMTVSIDGQATPENYRKFKIRMKNEPNDFAMMQEVLTRRFAQYIKSQNVNGTQDAGAGENLTEEIDTSAPASYTDIEGFTVNLPPELIKKMKEWKPDDSFRRLPSLIVIDGGKGQLSAAYKVLTDFGLEKTIPIVGLAKREEEIFKVAEQFAPENSVMVLSDASISKRTYQPLGKVDGFVKIKLPRKSEALYMLQRVRDEAHRFGITFHRKLRSKAALNMETVK